MKYACVVCNEVISSDKDFMETETIWIVCRRCLLEFRNIINNTLPEHRDFFGTTAWKDLTQLRMAR